MKAVLLKRSGSADGLVLGDLPVPVPQSNEVLVRVHAATVSRGDVVLRKLPRLVARAFGERRRTVLGHEFAGEIEAIGSGVAGFAPGDRLFGTTEGLTQGAYAEYVCVPEDGVLTTMPADITYEEAAPVPVGAMTALHFLRKGGVGSGTRVLINGASGSVGTFAVQIAKHLGATVTGVSSTANVDLVTSLGADRIIDYTRHDFTESGQTYDVVFDTVGTTSAKQSKPVLAEDGAFVTTQSRRRESSEELLAVKELLEAEAIHAVIDRRYTFEQIPEAHRYVEQGHKRGNIVITVEASAA